MKIIRHLVLVCSCGIVLVCTGCGSSDDTPLETSPANLHVTGTTVTLSGAASFPDDSDSSVFINGEQAALIGNTWSQAITVDATATDHAVQIDYVINGQTVSSKEYIFQLNYQSTEIAVE